MPDREKVIKGLKECAGNGNCTKCQYVKEKQALSCKKLLADTLELILKEYEPIAPTKIIDKEYHIIHHSCGNCHKVISSHPRASYCQWCGKAVDWNA